MKIENRKMGGCATKPKGLRAEDELAPAPAPAPTPATGKEEEPCVGSEVKEVGEGKIIEEEGMIEAGEGEKLMVEGCDEIEKVDEQGNKRKSLSFLFKENESENDETTQTEVIPSEPVKEEEDPKTEDATKESDTIVPEAENLKNPVEENPTPASKTVETEKPTTEAAPAAETEKAKDDQEIRTEEEKGIAA